MVREAGLPVKFKGEPMTIIEFFGGNRDGEQEIVPPRDRKMKKLATITHTINGGKPSVYKFQREEKKGKITKWIFAVDPGTAKA